jgi:hypothetical protein
MSQDTIYTKTAKGVLEVKNKTIRLSREFERVFSLVDGKSTVTEMLEKANGMAYEDLGPALDKLAQDGFIKVFSAGAGAAAAAPQADDPNETVRMRTPTIRLNEVQPGAAARSDLSDLDFTSPESLNKLNQVAEARARAEAEAKARAAVEAQARARHESEARAAMEAKAKLVAQAQGACKSTGHKVNGCDPDLND